ncbi:MAG: hypothetical protein HND43_05640 [Armatimonadetes bacterium]|nr:MAG: hypothetical protein EDM74_00085 [Armatimonadota bacterium]MBL1152202.1 hypothetical protein [Armatimonadota bacterium]NOG38864.1 hypothetical protein [Armatimonadota bacterium]GIK31281.1 MAG: succinate dehydrogenase cytochrome b558 subunit [Armatimonadota bacterium]HQU18579.1 hypothetical protein [Fimbriimonadaceae bacterium]
MSFALTRESFFWHRVHSLTGIVPIGFYMLQHLTLNSFSLAGPAKFDGVIGFFESVPKHVLLAAEVLLIWTPLLFHALYGLFIANRSKPNYFGSRYNWSQNLMYVLQRWSGIALFFFLTYHVISTTVHKYATNDPRVIEYAAWQAKLTENGYLLLAVYALGVLAASYHLSYGIWNFCIRWGITVSDRSQAAVQRFSAVAFVAITLLGWAALAGFLMH